MVDDFMVNAASAAVAVRTAVSGLRRAEGAVVLFSSIAAGRGFAGHCSIAMAKGAVEGLTRSLAAELSPRVRVNAIAPSLTRTPLSAGLTSDAVLTKAVTDLHPLKRLGEADDGAALADFLLSSNAGWITGQVIALDGGRSSLASRG